MNQRNNLLMMAKKLWTENGYHYTSMETISKACHSSKAGSYHYFASKEELAIEIVKKIISSMKAHILLILDEKSFTDKKKSDVIEEYLRDNLRKENRLLLKLLIEIENTNKNIRDAIVNGFNDMIEIIAPCPLLDDWLLSIIGLVMAENICTILKKVRDDQERNS